MAACFYPRGSKILGGAGAGGEGGSACPYLAYDPLKQHQNQHQPLKGHELLIFYCVILLIFVCLRIIDTLLLAGANNTNRSSSSTMTGEEGQDEEESMDDDTSKRIPALLRPQ
jgi:hypothetical protein